MRETTILRAVGDLMFPAGHRLSDDDVSWLRSRLRDGADLVFANLEMPFTNERKPATPTSLESFAGDPGNAPLLRELGIGCVNVGTNHCLDWGAEGIETTRALLDDLGIVHVGAGLNARQASAPALFDLRGRRWALLGYCKKGAFTSGSSSPGAALYKPKEVLKQIETLRGTVDCLVLSLHAGYEYCQYPDPKFVSECRSFVDAGADLVLGHHAHVLQAIEAHGGGLIAYNLGNFMFDSHSGNAPNDSMWRERHQTIILEVRFPGDGGKPQYSFEPLEIDERGIPVAPSPDARQRIAELMRDLPGKLDVMTTSEVYSEAVGRTLDREIRTYKKLWKEKGWAFLWPAIKGLRWRHVRMLFAYLSRRLFSRK